jgi:CRISPR-associated endonuclease Cas2
MNKQQVWIITYDIGNNALRGRVFKLLGGFGESRQKSVFLCHLNPRQKQQLSQYLHALPLDKEDYLDWFRVAESFSFNGQDLTASELSDSLWLVQ